MNEWSKKTLEIADSEDYLDRLYEIYPVEPLKRKVDSKTIKTTKRLFSSRKKEQLLMELLKLKKFPYKDSYVSFLRKDPASLSRNPKTVKRICNTLYGMGITKVLEGIKQPKDANTRRGNDFSR